MKMITTAIVCLFACAAMAEGTTAAPAHQAAPTAPAAAMQTKKETKAAPTAAMQAKKDETCAGKTGKDLRKCKAEMKKATATH